MANKKKMQKFHAMRRGEQRYGLSMNTEMYNGMFKLITEGSHRVFHMEKQSNRVSICAVHYDDQWIAGLTGAPLVSLLADQRYALLSAFAGANANENGNQGKIYLAAWSSASPLEVKLVGQAAEDIHSTFYLVSINCKSVLQGTTAVIEPLLFNWQVLHFSGLNSPSPYRSYLGPGKTSFIYRPALRNMFKSVSSLVLHLENENDSGIVPYIVSLWDNSIQAWTPLQVVGWGDQPIASPDKYVTPDGEVRLQLENTGNSAPFLKRVDFTLEVHP